jgi:RHS repeat-associated protein
MLRRDYDPWGRLSASANVAGWAFTGREYEPATALHYYRARYYDPSTGRFISEDPPRWGDRRNLYSYVQNKPDRLVDPSGRIAWGGGGGGAFAVAVTMGIAGDAMLFFVGDTRGNQGVLLCAGLGLAVGEVGELGLQVGALFCPNCKTICDLEGLYGQAFGGAAVWGGAMGTLGVSIGSRSFVINGTAGPAAGMGAFVGGGLGGCGLLWKRPECGC